MAEEDSARGDSRKRNAAVKRLRVLHIAANYPDGVFNQPTTQAVKNLVNITSDNFSHHVISIARIMPWMQERHVEKSGVHSYSYRAFPALVGAHISFMHLRNRIIRSNIGPFDLVHAHKLTVEGWVGQLIAQHYSIPLVVTVRGFTDLKILRARLDLGRRFRTILENASLVFVPAPWTKDILLSRFQGTEAESAIARAKLLPNAVGEEMAADAPLSHEASRAKFYTVFRAGQGRAKGFYSLIEAALRMADRLPQNFLDVIGCGEDSAEYEATQKKGLGACIRFLGKIPNTDVLRMISQYDGLLLPSRSETFGMSYAEALSCGVPLMFSANAGIDGFFDEKDIGARVNADSVDSIEHGLRFLLEESARLKVEVQRALRHGRFDIFKTAAIAEVYQSALIELVVNSADKQGRDVQ